VKYKKRIYEEKIFKISKLFKVIFLVGARQVGKSSLLQHLFPKIKNFVFDAVQDLYGARKNPDLFLEDFKAPLILDEVQFVPELLSSIKRTVDQVDQAGQYFLTGSQQISVLKTVSESMAGRVALIPIPGMTPQEMYSQFDSEKNWFLNYLKDPNNFYKNNLTRIENLPPRLEVIWRGGMPGIIDFDNESLGIYFSSYVQTYVERDVRLLENIQDLSEFGTFIALVAALTAQEINFAQLGREIGITPKTAQRWLQLLMHSYQWTELRAFSNNSIKRLAEKPKGIMTDTGLACYLQRISSPEALAVSPLQGAMFESYCFNMLKAFCGALNTMPNFYHWRTLAGAEVDIIVEIDGKLYPIEVKSTSNVTKADIKGLEAFFNTYPNLNVQNGIVIYAGKEVYRVKENIIAVPWDLV
jgi:predicted AAA+ superfamily ATPase